MQTSTPHSYARLKEHLADWKARSAAQPDDRTRQQEFLLLAENILQPELTKLAAIINEADIECEVFNCDDEDLTVGIHIDALQTTLRLSPTENSTLIRAAIAQSGRPNDQLEWFIPCHMLRTGGLERELQAAIVRILT